MFRGSIVALVTPFRNGRIDEDALQSLVEWHIAEGSHGLVPVGTTGESPTVSHDEHHRVVDLVIEAAAGRLPVIAGCRIEQYGRSDQPFSSRQTSWRRSCSRGHTLL